MALNFGIIIFYLILRREKKFNGIVKEILKFKSRPYGVALLIAGVDENGPAIY